MMSIIVCVHCRMYVRNISVSNGRGDQGKSSQGPFVAADGSIPPFFLNPFCPFLENTWCLTTFLLPSPFPALSFFQGGEGIVGRETVCFRG